MKNHPTVPLTFQRVDIKGEWNFPTENPPNFAVPVASHPVEKATEQGVSFFETLESTKL